MTWTKLEYEKPETFVDILMTDGQEVFSGWMEDDGSFLALKEGHLKRFVHVERWMYFPES